MSDVGQLPDVPGALAEAVSWCEVYTRATMHWYLNQCMFTENTMTFRSMQILHCWTKFSYLVCCFSHCILFHCFTKISVTNPQWSGKLGTSLIKINQYACLAVLIHHSFLLSLSGCCHVQVTSCAQPFHVWKCPHWFSSKRVPLALLESSTKDHFGLFNNVVHADIIRFPTLKMTQIQFPWRLYLGCCIFCVSAVF